MKILEKGKPWQMEVICSGQGNNNHGCGAKLLIEKEDLYRTTSYCRDESTDYITFRCPVCNCETDVYDIPFMPHQIGRKSK